MKSIVWFVVFCFAASSACSRSERAQAFEPATDSDIIARVNGVPITAAELDLWAGRGRPGASPSEELRGKALESLITREIIRQEAFRQGLDHEEATAKKLAALRAQYLAAQRDELVAAFNARETAAAAVADDEARAYFDAHGDELRTEYHLMQIAYSKDAGAIADAKRALDEGIPFETVAARRFPNLPADQRPWDLGFLRWSQLPAEWRAAVARLEPGGTSDVIKGAGERWWIIYLAAKRANPLVNFETERQAVTSMLQTEKLERGRAERIAALRKAAEVTYVKP